MLVVAACSSAKHPAHAGRALHEPTVLNSRRRDWRKNNKMRGIPVSDLGSPTVHPTWEVWVGVEGGGVSRLPSFFHLLNSYIIFLTNFFPIKLYSMPVH